MTMVETSGAGVSRAPRPSSLADVLDLILDKGLVIDAYVRISLAGIELLTIDARVVVASVDTYLRFAEAVGRLDLAPTEERGIDALTGRGRSGGSSNGRGQDSGSESSQPAGRGEGDEKPRRRSERSLSSGSPAHATTRSRATAKGAQSGREAPDDPSSDTGREEEGEHAGLLGRVRERARFGE